MALNPSNSSNLEQLALKGLIKINDAVWLSTLSSMSFKEETMMCIKCQLLIVVQVHKGHLAKHAAVHDPVVDFHGCNDREGHCL